MVIDHLRTVVQNSLHKRASWLAVLVAVYVLLGANIDFAAHLTWHDGQRLAQLALMALALSFALGMSAIRNDMAALWLAVPRTGRLMLYAAFVLGAVSAGAASLVRWALLEWGMLLSLVFLTVAVAAGRRGGGVALDRLLIGLLSLAAAVYTVKTVVVYVAMLTVGAGHGMNFDVHDLFTGFSNVRFFGHIQTMALPFLMLPAMCWAQSTHQRILLGVVPVLWWMLVAAAGTRGTWLGLAMGALTVLVFCGHTGRRWMRWQIVGIASGLACYALFVLWVPSLVEQPSVYLHRANDMTSLSLRELIWAGAIEITQSHPLLGIGPMHFAHHPNAVAAHPHNTLLQFSSEWGVPAALLFTAVFAVAGIAFALRVRTVAAGQDLEQGSTAAALLAAVSGATAQAMVDGVLVMPMSQMTLVLVCGWALGLYYVSVPAKSSGSIVEKVVCTLLVLFAAGSVIYGVYPEIGQLAARETAYLKAQPPGTMLLPRFWAQGWIGE